MLEQFGQTNDPAVAYDVVDACVLQSNSISDMSRLIPLAEVASTWFHGAERIRGAALCRAGKFEESLRSLQAAQRLRQFRPWDWAFLALTHHHLGDSEQSSECLARAREWMHEADQEELDDIFGLRPSWGDWYERAEAERLLEEVESLMRTSATQ
jgi:hypothetical protein